jgi:predicted metal-dependent peptidase
VTVPAAELLTAARTRLILTHPFFGALALHLTLRPASPTWCRTVAVDGRSLFFNPDYIQSCSVADLKFLLAHEAMHCALGHFARRGHRLRRRWDVACDHAVNLLLQAEGLPPMAGALLDNRFNGMSAEEIYPLVPDDTAERTLDVHVFDAYGVTVPSSGAASALGTSKTMDEATPGITSLDGWDDAGHEAREDALAASRAHLAPEGEAPPQDTSVEQTWKSWLASAAHDALRAGRLSSALKRSIDHLIQPQLPWRALLARYLVSAARDDYSFQPNPRREGSALLPRLASREARVIAVLDTSGSISRAEMQEFATEVDALKGQIRAQVTLQACDEDLAPDGPWRFAAWEAIELPVSLQGGGGTRFTPVFEWVDREMLRPDVLLYFTDAQGEFPPAAPPYPVIWLVKGRAPVPWGERVQLN